MFVEQPLASPGSAKKGVILGAKVTYLNSNGFKGQLKELLWARNKLLSTNVAAIKLDPKSELNGQLKPLSAALPLSENCVFLSFRSKFRGYALFI